MKFGWVGPSYIVKLCPSLDCYSDLWWCESVWETGPRNSSGILDFSRLRWNFWDNQTSPDFHLTDMSLFVYRCGSWDVDVKDRNTLPFFEDFLVLTFSLALVGEQHQQTGEVFALNCVSLAMSSTALRERVRKSLSKSIKGNACKFRFTITYEYVDLKCNNRW